MTILVTGGSGYIGSHICVELLNNDYNVIAIDNLMNSVPETIERVKKITNRSLYFYEVDLLDKERLDKIFIEHDIQGVVHVAGLKSVEYSIKYPIEYYHNNFTAALNLCEIMTKHSVKNLVFSSSATVYGNINELPIKEDSPLRPTTPYGRSKMFIESMLYDLYSADNEWSIAILRYFNPIGAHESGIIGESSKGTPNNIMPYLLQVALGKREKFYVYGNDYGTKDGTGVRDYIHVSDLADGHLKALNHITNNSGIDVFNLGTGIGYSVLDVIQTLTKVTGRTINYEISKKRPGDIGESYADTTKAREKLGWMAKRNLEDMCMDAWRWQILNPNGYI